MRKINHKTIAKHSLTFAEFCHLCVQVFEGHGVGAIAAGICGFCLLFCIFFGEDV